MFCSGATVAGSLGCHSLLQRRLLLSSFPAQTTVHIICLKVCPFSDAARATFLPTFAAVSINRWGPVRCLAQRGTPPPLGSFVGYWRRWFALLLPIYRLPGDRRGLVVPCFIFFTGNYRGCNCGMRTNVHEFYRLPLFGGCPALNSISQFTSGTSSAAWYVAKIFAFTTLGSTSLCKRCGSHLDHADEFVGLWYATSLAVHLALRGFQQVRREGFGGRPESCAAERSMFVGLRRMRAHVCESPCYCCKCRLMSL